MKYYHLSKNPLHFKDSDGFSKRAHQPRGMYCTKWRELFPDMMWGTICRARGQHPHCYLYAFQIPDEKFTVDVSSAQPDKILRVTLDNWVDVSQYMQTHTIHDMHAYSERNGCLTDCNQLAACAVTVCLTQLRADSSDAMRASETTI
jgi:hypothetical protein